MIRGRFFNFALCLLPYMFASPAAQDSSATPQTPSAIIPGDPVVTYYTIPFVPLPGQGMPVIRARISDETDIAFVLDTGSTICIVSDAFAKAHALMRYRLTSPTPDIKPEDQPRETVTIPRIDIGTFYHSGGQFVVSDVLANAVHNDALAGVLSADLFGRGAVLFDFEGQEISFVGAGNLNKKQLAWLGFGDDATTATLTATDKGDWTLFTVKGRVIGKDGKILEDTMILDTGNTRTTFSGDPAQLGLIPLGKSGSHMLDGPHSRLNCIAGSVQVEDVDTSRPGATLMHAPCYFDTSPRSAPMHASNLGMDFLSHFRVLIDYPARKLYLAPLTHDATLPFPTETARVSGERLIGDATFKPSATAQWSVASLAPGDGNFRYYGLLVGDVIVTLRGKKTDGLNPDELVALIMKAPNDVPMTILRNGRLMTL